MMTSLYKTLTVVSLLLATATTSAMVYAYLQMPGIVKGAIEDVERKLKGVTDGAVREMKESIPVIPKTTGPAVPTFDK